MATATAPTADRERLEIIWNTITRDAVRAQNSPDVGVGNSKRYLRVDRILEEFAAQLVTGGFSDDFDPTSEYSETSTLLVATEDIWTFIQKTLIDWALEVEATRSARRSHVA